MKRMIFVMLSLLALTTFSSLAQDASPAPHKYKMAAVSIWKETSPTTKELMDTTLVNIGGWSNINDKPSASWKRNVISSCLLGDDGEVEYDINQIALGLSANVAYMYDTGRYHLKTEYGRLLDMGVATAPLNDKVSCSVQTPQVAVRSSSVWFTYDAGTEMEVSRTSSLNNPTLILTVRMF